MHIGELIRNVAEGQGRSAIWLAEQLSYNRANIYKIYQKSSIDTDLLLRISKALNHDFFRYYSNDLEDRKEL